MTWPEVLGGVEELEIGGRELDGVGGTEDDAGGFVPALSARMNSAARSA